MAAALAALVVAVLLVACEDRVNGNGQTATEQRTVPAFTKLEVSGAINAGMTIDGPQAASVTADSNIVPIILTEVRGSTLVVRPKEDYDARTPVSVAITVAGLTAIEVTGASTVTASGYQGGDLALDASGASTIRASGRVESVDAEASGASHLRLFDLAATDADVGASGASSVEVQVSGTLSGDASGASTVRYRGNPTVKVGTSGASSVRGE